MNNAQVKVTYYFATAASEKKLVRIYTTMPEAFESIQKKQKAFRDLYKVVIENL